MTMIKCDCGCEFESERQYCHLLLCGDTTDSEQVGRLMGQERFTLMVTDPPYGVSYAAKNEFLNAYDKGNKVQTAIEGDHRTVDEMSDFWKLAFGTVRPFAAPGATYYVTGPQGGDLLLLLLALRASDFPLRHMLIWAKNNHVLGRSDYNYKHEPIIYGWVKGSHKFYAGHDVSLWEIKKPQQSDLHPTTKPLELFERAVANSSAPGDVVADWFLGSGTLLVACERLGRLGRGMELAEGYAAVSLERLAGLGLAPRLVE